MHADKPGLHQQLEFPDSAILTGERSVLDIMLGLMYSWEA